MLSQHSGSQSLLGDAFKVADAALQPQDVPTNGDAGTGARADEKLTDDLNDILQPFHWEAWKAALFSDHPDGWPDDDEQDARSEEHTSELQSLMRISYAVFCLKKTTNQYKITII